MSSELGKLLWVDDEVELLRAHILFLQKKGYAVETAASGADAVDLCRSHSYDLILLDEMMPGITGLETLQQIKEMRPAVPVVMVTKSEAEDIMDQAIGSQIADYLIKPVNPHQILLTLKKNLHVGEIVTEATESGYRREYQDIMAQTDTARTLDDWKALYRRLTRWEIALSQTPGDMGQLLQTQRAEANRAFARYIRAGYLDWLSLPTADPRRPMMSTDIFRRRIFPLTDHGERTVLVVIDNFRYDQWRMIAHELAAEWDMDEDLYLSILPTATQYARNAIFSGLMPADIQRMFPDLWVDDGEEEGKNLCEAPLIETQIQRFRRHITFSYHKWRDSAEAAHFLDHIDEEDSRDLTVIVMNFIDMLSHARTESPMIRELAADEAAYRQLTLGWYRHSALATLLHTLARKRCRVVITTDHGSIRVSRPVRIVGDRNTNTNLRYKLGKNLACSAKDVFTIRNPRQAMLPAPNLSTTYAVATGSDFFAYPNNYNYYAAYYRDTFQHGGISLEEMMIPVATLTSKN